MSLFRINFRRSFSGEDTLVDSDNEYDFNFIDKNKNYKLTQAQFELGSRILESFSEQITKRLTISKIYENFLEDVEGIQIIKTYKEDLIHYIRYPILVKSNRNTLIKSLNRNGIEATNLYQTLDYRLDDFPGSKKIKEQILTLPCHPNMRKIDIIKTIIIIKNFSIGSNKK